MDGGRLQGSRSVSYAVAILVEIILTSTAGIMGILARISTSCEMLLPLVAPSPWSMSAYDEIEPRFLVA